MHELELNGLEQQIDSCVESFRQLTTENGSLRKKLDQFHHERTTHADKKKKITASLKKIIMQLQDELSCRTR